MEIFPGRTFVIEYEVFAEDPQLTVAGTARLSSHHVCEGLEPQQASHRLALHFGKANIIRRADDDDTGFYF